jgi:Domain of unknown function (DUF4037)
VHGRQRIAQQVDLGQPDRLAGQGLDEDRQVYARLTAIAMMATGGPTSTPAIAHTGPSSSHAAAPNATAAAAKATVSLPRVSSPRMPSLSGLRAPAVRQAAPWRGGKRRRGAAASGAVARRPAISTEIQATGRRRRGRIADVAPAYLPGEVFHDGAGELTRARARLAWYPRDVWLYVLACQWQRIGQEEAFPGRCAEAGDDLGSVIVTARLARDLMRLCLLMHRRYPPYSKWLGTAFAQLPGTAGVGAALAAAISAADWGGREQHMCRAYETIAAWHNELGSTPPLDTPVRRFYERPYQVIDAARFTAALREAIADPRVRNLPLTGAIDQFTDSTDALGRLGFLRACVGAAIGEPVSPAPTGP